MKGVIMFVSINRGVKALVLLSPGNRVMEVHVNTLCEEGLTSTDYLMIKFDQK